ncbi:MAG: hypothetical protein ACR2PR_02400 [Pseudohongiellaceae bacterium]
MKNKIWGFTLVLALIALFVLFLCDDRLGGILSGIIIALGSVLLAAYSIAKLCGVYVLRHSAGETMLGSTLSGDSGAGTKGILKGTARIGKIVAFFIANLIAKAVIIICMLAGVSLGFYEWFHCLAG